MSQLIEVIQPNNYFCSPDCSTTIADLSLLCDFAERKRPDKQKYIDATNNIRGLIEDGLYFNRNFNPDNKKS